MKTAFLFPGQGAQAVGMGKDLCEAFPAARAIFDRAEELSKLPLKKLCFEGPEEELARTDIAQPAIFTASAALLTVLKDLLGGEKFETIRPAYMAGLSLGEYTALYAAGCLDFQDALRLVTLRGAAMQKAATAVPSGMVAVMGLDEAKATELCHACAEGEVLVPANFNATGQVVVSGSIAACGRAEARAKEFGASGAMALKVAGAFHSPLMAPAAHELGAALDSVSFRCAAGGPVVVANVNAQPYGQSPSAKELLMSQLTGAVRWQQSVEFLMAQGVERFLEIGPGKVLAGLMRRINRRANIESVNSREAVEKLAASL